MHWFNQLRLAFIMLLLPLTAQAGSLGSLAEKIEAGSAVVTQSGVEIPCVNCEQYTQRTEPHTGMWYNQDQTAQGFSIDVQNGTLAGVYYGYDQTGVAIWQTFVGDLLPAEDVGVMWVVDATLNQFSNSNCFNCEIKGFDLVEAGTIQVKFKHKNYASISINGGAEQHFTPFVFGHAATADFPQQTDYLFPDLEGMWSFIYHLNADALVDTVVVPNQWGFTSKMLSIGKKHIAQTLEGHEVWYSVATYFPHPEIKTIGTITCKLIDVKGQKQGPVCEFSDNTGFWFDGYGMSRIFKFPPSGLGAYRIFGETNNRHTFEAVKVSSEVSTDSKYSDFITADILGIRWSNEQAYNIAELSDALITDLGAEKVFWQHLEPSVDSGFYWQELDTLVRNVQQGGGNIRPTIWSVSDWATKVTGELAPSSAPSAAYEDRYSDFIRAFVERYDADGIDDLPNISRPIKYLQIEDEAQNLGDSWNASSSCDALTGNSLYECAANEYGDMLKLAYQAAHEADPNIKIVSFSFNPGDYFDHNTAQIPVIVDRLAFLEVIYTNYSQYFDVIGLQCNYDYTGIPAWVNFIKDRYQLNKEIICADAASMPMVGKHQYYSERYINKYPYMSDSEILTILSQGLSHSRYNEIKAWWESSKAMISVKKAVVSLAEGLQSINFQFVMAFSKTLNSWDYSGLSSGGIAEQADGPIGTPRAVLHALSQLNELLIDFERIENLNPIKIGDDPYSWNWLYRITNATGSNIYIFWNESNSEINFSEYLTNPSQTVTEFIVELDQNFDPIFQESLTSSYQIATSGIPQFIIID